MPFGQHLAGTDSAGAYHALLRGQWTSVGWRMPEGNAIARKMFECYLRSSWHPGKLAAVHLLLRGLAFESVRSRHGPILCGSPNDFTGTLAISGAYGRLISDHIQQLSPDAAFVDIGASYGLFTILASQQLTRGHVLAFEPNPDIYQRLIKASRLNGSRNVTAVQSAVGPTAGLMNLQYNPAHSGMARLVEIASACAGEFVSVSVINPAESDLFDQALTSNELHIKIDVEGFELEIIRALRQAPWYRRICSMVVEIDDGYLNKYGSEAGEIYQVLQYDGFAPRVGIGAGRHYDEIFARH